MSVTVITPDNEFTSIILPEEPPLKWMQEQVGGYKVVNLNLTFEDSAIEMIVDDEGLVKEKDVNPIGTALLRQTIYNFSGEQSHRLIAGTIIILTNNNLMKA